MDVSSAQSAVEFLSHCWVPVIYLKSRFLYAYGNTAMEDILEDLQVSDTMDILLLGAGDIRHVLKTVAGLKTRPRASGSPSTLRFHVNDVDNEVISRNVVLLEIMSSSNPDDIDDIEFLWDVWYNMTLTEGHYRRLKVTLERLLTGSSSSQWKFGDGVTKKQVMTTLRSWLEAEPWEVENVKKSRQECFEFYSGVNKRSFMFSMPVEPFYKDVSMMEASTVAWSKHFTEWNTVHEAGIARDFVGSSSRLSNKEFINPTMMRPGSSRWHVHYGSNPIAAYLPFERTFLDRFPSLVRACIAKLQIVIRQYQAVSNKLSVSVSLWSCDAFHLCQFRLSLDTQFDVIDTSNLADHVSLLNLFAACEQRLKNSSSILKVEVFRWIKSFENIQDYIKTNTG